MQNVSGSRFKMRNKLQQRITINRDVARRRRDRHRDQAQTSEVITVVSDSSCSDDETPPKTGSGPVAANRTRGSNSIISVREVQPLQERRETPSDNKLAPVFLCPRLRRKDTWSRDIESCPQTSQQLPPLSHDSQKVQDRKKWLSTYDGQVSPPSVNICLERIQASKPPFPLQSVFSSLQRKARDQLQHLKSTEVAPCPGPPQNHIKEKRKRGDNLPETPSKRQRCAGGAAGMDRCHMPAQDVEESIVLQVKELPRGSRLSRTHRLRRQSSAGLVSSGWTTEADSQASIESRLDDVLWTDKYSPQNSSEVIGNSVSVNTLFSWLKKWKLRADAEEGRKTEESKREENSSDSWDCGDFQGESGADDVREQSLCNTVLITGPPGVGKTASVYACAQELGFKVFEVNCSSQRSGRHVLSQLKEATQSHLVETSGKDPLKPAYFKNFTSSSCTLKSEHLPGKTKIVVSTTKKRPKQKSRLGHRGTTNPASVTLARYFKTKAKADHLLSGGLSSTEKLNTKKPSSPSPARDATAPRSKKTATCLILFEEVDVIFEDDVGFLAAVKTFMATTKRPVVLTTTDPSFRTRFGCSLQEINFKTPAAGSVCSYLQLVCLAEKVQLATDDVNSLARLTRGDVRRCLLQLQLWVRSGGGIPPTAQHSDAGKEGVPPCEAGCTASMLGLGRVSQFQLLNYLKSQDWSETDTNELQMLLGASWRRSVPLLYTNLELLLPIRASEPSVRCLTRMFIPGLQAEKGTWDAELDKHQLNGNVILKSIDSKCLRKPSRLSRRKYNMCAKNSSSRMRRRTELDVETDLLVALMDFFDLMSYIDATLSAKAPLVSGSCRPEAFHWTGAEIKDGLLDERSEEDGGSWSQEMTLNLQAAVEGLGCHMCYWRLSEAQKYGQTREDKTGERLEESSTASKTQSLSFVTQHLCGHSAAQRRYELSRAVFGSESFGLLGNRRAVCVDYVPVLRSVCRFQRAQQEKEEPVRYKNFLSGKDLGLSRLTMKLLAEDFS